jgi:type I restriction enzyme S subunit
MTNTEWKTIALGELVEPAKTWNPSRSPSDEVFDYIDVSAIDQDAKLIIGAREVSCAEAPSRARQLVARGDVLVSTVRPNLNGVARVPDQLDGATASTGFCVLRAREPKLDGGYLFHWVKSPSFVADMVNKATGASYPAVSDRILFDSRIPLPPLAEQRRIADVLDRAEVLRTKRRSALAQLNSLTQSLFLDLHRQTARKSHSVPLAQVAEGTRGSFVNGPFGSDLLTSELRDEGVPVIYIRDIRDGEYRRVSKSCVSERKAHDLAVCSVRPGDVLIAKVGDPPGIAAVYPDGQPIAVVTQDVIRIRVSPQEAIAEFIVGYLNSSIGMWKVAGITIEATRARFSLKDFKGVKIELPPIKLQHEFACRVGAVEKLKAAQRASLAELDALFASLQHRAFRGEL